MKKWEYCVLDTEYVDIKLFGKTTKRFFVLAHTVEGRRRIMESAVYKEDDSPNARKAKRDEQSKLIARLGLDGWEAIGYRLHVYKRPLQESSNE